MARLTIRLGAMGGLVALGLTAAVSAAPAASATTATRTTGAITARIEHGSSGRVVGAVSPNRYRHPVVLQRYYSAAWHNVASQALNSSSRYAFTITPNTNGTYKYRVVKPVETGYARSVTGTLTTTAVAKVRPLLTTYQSVASDSNYNVAESPDQAVVSNGQTYPHSLAMRYDSGSRLGVGYQEYAIGGHWGSLRTTLGLEDNSPSGRTGKVEIFTDGKSNGVTTLKLGQTVPVTIGLAGVQRLRIQSLADWGPNIMVGSPVLSSDTFPSVIGQAPVAAWLDSKSVVQSDSNYSYANRTSQVSELSGDYYGDSWTYLVDSGCGTQCGDGYSEVSLGRAYSKLTFHLGLDDAYGTGTGQVTITGDGATIWSGTAPAGSIQLIEVNVTNVLRLRITVTGAQGTMVDLGDARLYS